MTPNQQGVAAGQATAIAVPWGDQWTVEGITRLFEPMVLARRRARLKEVLGGRLMGVTLLLDELDDPHNRSAIVRTCDAFGIQKIHALQAGSQFAIHHGAAAGTERWVDVHQHASAEAAISTLQDAGFELIATHPEGELSPEQLGSVAKPALILGNEHRGLQPALAKAATRTVRVPMRGFVESLNVSVSAALLLRAATQQRAGDLSETELAILYARSLFRSVPRSLEILQASVSA